MKKASLYLVLAMVLSAHSVQAASLKNSEFVKFSDGQRHWWYLGAFTSLGHAATLEDKKKGQCVLNWLYSGGTNKEVMLTQTLKKYPDQTPTGIIIAILRRDCGVFKSTKTSSLSSNKTKAAKLLEGWQMVGGPCFGPPYLAVRD